jgi:hypothetical protein
VSVLVLQVFVSLMLVVGSLVLLAYSVKHADHEHADRLSLLPIEDDDARAPAATERDA